MKTLKNTIATMLFATSVVAFAGPDSAIYVGVGLNQARHNYSSTFIRSMGYNTYTSDDSSTNGKIYGGYRFNRYVGAELFYNNLGRSYYEGIIGGRNSRDEFKSDGFGAVAIGRLPLGGSDFALIGKLGFMNVRTTYTCMELCNNVTNTKNNAVAPVIGAGVEYDLNKNIGVRVDYERINGGRASFTAGSTTSTTRPMFDVISLGLNLKF